MSKLLLGKLKAEDVYYVATTHVSSAFKSTTIGGIKEAISAIGKVVGSIQNGHINLNHPFNAEYSYATHSRHNIIMPQIAFPCHNCD